MNNGFKSKITLLVSGTLFNLYDDIIEKMGAHINYVHSRVRRRGSSKSAIKVLSESVGKDKCTRKILRKTRKKNC